MFVLVAQNSIILCAGTLLVSTTALAADLPLKPLPDDNKRDHRLPEQANAPGKLEALQKEAFRFSGVGALQR